MNYRIGSKAAGLAMLWLALAGGLLPISAQYLGPAATLAGPKDALPQQAAEQPPADIRILPGDVVSFDVLGAPELGTQMHQTSGEVRASNSAPFYGVRVGPRGELTIPYVGAVIVAGMTTEQASTAIAGALKEKGVLVDPQVVTRIEDSPSRVISIVGEVKNPMVFSGATPIRLMHAISACGGLTPLASHAITIRHAGQQEPLTVDLGVDPRANESVNIALQAGDTVIVPSAGSVFVLGEVKTSQSFPLSGATPITVMRAVTLAGGLKYSAALSKVRVIRPIGDNRQVEIMFDLKKVMEGKQQDIALRANDLLFVPANTFKALVAAGGVQAASQAMYFSALTSTQLK